jgi:hypothetical protein
MLNKVNFAIDSQRPSTPEHPQTVQQFQSHYHNID